MTQARRSVRIGAIVRDIVEAVLLAVVLFLVLQVALQNTIVDGPSMEPNFQDRQWLLVNKLAYRIGAPRHGDVIVFDAPDGSGREFIKRVIAVPGETVRVRQGIVQIDGRDLEEPWLPQRDDSAFGPYLVPEGQLFVLGDNRPNSNDSRAWGGLDRTMVIGKAWVSIWPPSAAGLVRADRPGPVRSAAAAK